MPLSSFRNQALAGFTAVIVLLVGGMVFAVRRLDALATSELAYIQIKEKENTVVERLR